jgi:alpha-beta hydrolase superfamily lysophospholipase
VRLRRYHWPVEGARGVVLLVHGFGDHAGRYPDLVRILGERGYAVTAYDQRGHGASEGRRGHAARFELFLTDLDVVWADAASGLDAPLFLYGHSFGALVAMRWLQTRPTRPAGVVLSAPWLATAIGVPRWKLWAAAVLLRIAPSLTIPSGSNVPEYLTRDPERIAAYWVDPLRHHVISARFHAGLSSAQEAVSAEPLPAGVPTLLLVPGADLLVDAAATLHWARVHGRGVEVRVREGGRHEAHNDVGREAVLHGVADWLDTRAGPNPVGEGRVSRSRNDPRNETGSAG